MSEAPAMSAVFPHPLPIDLFFGLDRSEYLTVPRAALASMPAEWQGRFVALMDEMDTALKWRPEEGRYWVELRDSKGRIVSDPLRDYRRVRLAGAIRLVADPVVQEPTLTWTEPDGTTRRVALSELTGSKEQS